MAESAVSNHPVPKPRVSRTHTSAHSTPTPPTLSPDASTDQDPPASAPPLSDPSSTDPPPYSSLLSPSPTQHTDSDRDPSDVDLQIILRPRKPKATPTSQDDEEDDDYENIDAILDEEERESIRRSDYINWVCLDPDGDEGQSSRGSSGARIGHDRYAPSIKLDRHPLLKKSQSNSEISNSGAELLEALRRRPRNRAPPPPPGTKKDKGQGAANAPPVSGSGHKRSRSDLSGHSPEPPRLSGGQSPNVARVAPTRPVGRLSPGQKRGMPPRPPYQRSPESSRCEVKDQSTPKEAANVKPKRQAPPPPAARRGVGEGGVFPEYASVNKQRVRGDQSDPLTRRQSSSSGDSVGPPKPARTRRSKSTENLMRETEQKPIAVTTSNYILDSMDLFTLELKKDRDVSFGLVIVTGKVRDTGGEGVLEGVFVQKVIPDSPADNDGRIQPGDMLVEVGGCGMVGGALDDTIQLLKDARESIRLRIARPNVSSSVFTVEGDDEQPIYENDLLPPAEMMLRLHQTEGRLTEVEAERDRALTELLAIREQTEREKAEFNSQLEEMKRQLEEGRVESESRATELTQALTSVTVGRSKVESELESLRAEVRELREKLRAADMSGELESLRQHNTQLKAELDRERQRSSQLQEKLDIAESAKEGDAEEVEKLRKKISAQEDQIASLKLDLEQLRNTRATPLQHMNSDLTPVDIKEVNGHHDDDGSCSDDAFDERVPSPVTPSPYLDFVPLEEGDRKERKKEKPAMPEPVVGTDETVVEGAVDQTTAESGGGVEDETSTEQGDQAAVATAELDAMVPSTTPLNSSAALHKSHIGKKLFRKKPSQQYLRTMGSSFDLLDPQSEEEATPTEPVDHTPEKTDTVEASPTSKSDQPSSPPEKPAPSQETTVTPQPKPRPRPRPRHTVSHDDRKPQVTPRHREVEGKHSREGSPVPPPTAHDLKKPVVPSPMTSPAHPNTHEPSPVNDHAHNPPHETPPVDGHTHQTSPLVRKKEPLLPSPKPSPKHLSKVPKMPPAPPSKDLKPVEPGESEPAHPTPHPRHQPSVEEPSHAEGEPKITVESPVKVATGSSSAPGSPVKTRHPPPVPKKPKHEEDHTHHTHYTHEREFSPRRSKSFDNEIDESPRPKKKLPAGAVNIMGFLPVHARLKHEEEEPRDRSLTVSTSEPGAMERNSLKRQIEKHEGSPLIKTAADHTHQNQEVGVAEVNDHAGTADLKKVPPKRPPPPKKPTEQVDGVNSSDEVDSDASPMLATKVEHSSVVSATVKYGEVLSWPPEAVGGWLEKIGLGRHKQVFGERGIHGHMLFDMDGHSLKGMGLDSHDDRAMFKKEVKVLKPFADKQRKAMEKLKKEEKKNAKKRKK